jgi:hypothetical protein
MIGKILVGIIVGGLIFLTIGFIRDCAAERARDRDPVYQQCLKDPTCVQ